MILIFSLELITIKFPHQVFRYEVKYVVAFIRLVIYCAATSLSVVSYIVSRPLLCNILVSSHLQR